jgi:hypothetical protein
VVRERAQRCAERVYMSTCNGKVVRDGIQWHCLDCGCVSTSWSMEHQPLQAKARHFLLSLVELANEVDEQADVGVAPATL